MAFKTNKTWRTKKGRYYHDLITRADTERGDMMERREAVRALYYKEPGGFVVTDDIPWEGAVEIHAPVIAEKIETATPKTVSAMWRAHPFVNIKSPGGKLDNYGLKNVETFAGWAFQHDIEDAYENFENWIRNMLIDGTAFLKVYWDRKFRRAIDRYHIKSSYKKGQIDYAGNPVNEDRAKTDPEILAEVFGVGDITNGMVNFKANKKQKHYEVTFTDGGRMYEGIVTIDQSEIIDQLEVRVHRQVLEYDAPRYELVDLYNIVLPSRSKSVQSAKWVAQRTFYSLAEIKRKVKDGEWTLTEEELQQLAGFGRENDKDNPLDAQKDLIQGQAANTGSALVEMPKKQEKGFDPNRILVWELYVRDFSDGQDNPVDVIHFILDDTQTIAGTMYHDEVFPHGKRPFPMIKYIPVPGRIYGWGMADLLYGINEEVNHTLSLVHNLTELVANPFFFYTPYAAMANDKTLKGLRPGEGVPTTDPRGVVFAQFSQQPLQLLHASFNTLLGYADRLTFSPSVGGSSNYRNAPRTAKGTMALMNAAEEHLSAVVEQIQETGWKTLVSQVLGLYGVFVSTEKWFHVTGEYEPRKLNPRALRGNLQFSFSGSLTSVNRDIQRELVRNRYLMAREDPLYASDPRARQALLASFLRLHSEGTDVDAEIPSLPGEGGYDHAPLDQDIEIEAMIQGIRISVLPVDPHQEHLAEIDKFKKSDMFNRIPSTAVAMLAEHENAHKAAMQQQIAMQTKMAQMGQGMGTPEGQGEMSAEPVPEPGAPIAGIPAEGGAMSFGEGGPVA
jgi:hypothetical protein